MDCVPPNGIELTPEQAIGLFPGAQVVVQVDGPSEPKRRKSGVRPDRCDVLHIRGQEWLIPKRSLYLKPKFVNGQYQSNAADDGLDEQTRNIVAEFNALLCKQDALLPSGAKYLIGDVIIGPLFSLAAHVLRLNYSLTDHDVEYLLYVSRESTWPQELIRWAVAADSYEPPADEQGFAELCRTALQSIEQTSVPSPSMWSRIKSWFKSSR